MVAVVVRITTAAEGQVARPRSMHRQIQAVVEVRESRVETARITAQRTALERMVAMVQTEWFSLATAEVTQMWD